MGALKSKKCSKGHPLKGDNLYIRKNGKRDCRQCSRNRQKAWYRKKRTPLKRTATIRAKRTKPRRVSVIRDRGYMRWLKTQNCIACRAMILNHQEPGIGWASRTIDPCHTENNGGSSKGSDAKCVPLCRSPHHAEMDGRLNVRVTTKEKFAAKYGLDLARESAELYARYLTETGQER